MNDDSKAQKGQSQKTPVMLARAVLGVVLGGLAGFGMNRYIGCADGTCLITASPWGSIVYWMILGFVVSQIQWPGKSSQCQSTRHDVDGQDS